MEARVTKSEYDITVMQSLCAEIRGIRAEIQGLRSEHRADIRLTWGGMIALAIGLAGMMAKGFHWI